MSHLVTVHYKDASTPLVYEGVENTYVKAGLFCVYIKARENGPAIVPSTYKRPGVYKHPLANIWRIFEEYS